MRGAYRLVKESNDHVIGMLRRLRLFTTSFAFLLGAFLVATLAAAVYLPYLGNPRIFDDWGFFSGERFAYYATHPLGLGLRVPPYFTLAVTELFFGQTRAHRIVSLLFHAACALTLYRLVYDLLKAVRPAAQTAPLGASPTLHDDASCLVPALFAAAAFAVHPVAVYGAGYLVQRSIVLATLFSILSVWLFFRGLTHHRFSDALLAGLMYSAAVLSKEHSILLPAAAILSAFLAGAGRDFSLRYSAAYLAACAPAAILVFLLRKSLIGNAYEPDFDIVSEQLDGAFGQDVSDFSWLLSAVTQAGLFFKYLVLWLWPDTGSMSIDMRVHFLDQWSAGWVAAKLAALAGFGAIGGWLLVRGGRAGLVGFGILYTLILFLVELTAARFQEPFVLYRSYLWAPGILIAVGAVLSALSVRYTLAAFVVVCPLLFYQAQDRLTTFSSTFLLWKDAVAKLPDRPVPWGSRTLFNLAREFAHRGQPDVAFSIAERCLKQYPETFHCYSSRGLIHLQLGEFDEALPYLTRAVELNRKSGQARHRLGWNLENLGRLDEAKMLYMEASSLGFGAAKMEVRRLESRLGQPVPSGAGISGDPTISGKRRP
jgi:hypothetical protein